MLTREEMKDIWDNKPYGYWGSLRKRNKGTKRYKVKIQPYKIDYYESKEVCVMAKNIDEAYSKAKVQVTPEFKDQIINGWRMMGAKPV